jgi:hypothetical protein
MDGTHVDQLARRLAIRLDRRRGIVAAAAIGSGAVPAFRSRRAAAQVGRVMPGDSCAEHRECVLRMDAPATFCLPRENARICCSIQDGLCETDAECCGAGTCIAGLCANGPRFDTWITLREVGLLAGPDAASAEVRRIPAGSKVRVISAAPVGGWLTATWEGAYGWVPASLVVFVGLGVV